MLLYLPGKQNTWNKFQDDKKLINIVIYSDFSTSICNNRKSRKQEDFRPFRTRSIQNNYVYAVLNMENRCALNSPSGSHSACMKNQHWIIYFPSATELNFQHLCNTGFIQTLYPSSFVFSCSMAYFSLFLFRWSLSPVPSTCFSFWCEISNCFW